MKKFSRILVVLAVLSMAIGLMTGCGNKKSEKSDNQSSVEQIKKNGKIKVGVFSDKPPFGYVDKNGKNQGYDVVLAHRLAKDLLGDENKVEFVLVEAASRVEFLQSNKVDVILANFTVTDERKEVVDYAHTISSAWPLLLSPASFPVSAASFSAAFSAGFPAALPLAGMLPDSLIAALEQAGPTIS